MGLLPLAAPGRGVPACNDPMINGGRQQAAGAGGPPGERRGAVCGAAGQFTRTCMKLSCALVLTTVIRVPVSGTSTPVQPSASG